MPAYPAIQSVVAALGGRAVLRRDVQSLADLSGMVEAGLPMRSLERLSASYPVGDREKVASAVAPRTTRLRRSESGVLSTAESERLERIARLTALASHVLDSDIEGRRFLVSSHPLLGGQTPLELAVTDLGARRVEELLWRLEYSLPV
jgi:putative toxin-antitoxin system antitoxin component (TIGR02293 family)